MLIDNDLKKGKDTSFYSGISKSIGIKLNAINWDFIGKRKVFYIISILIIAGGLASLFTKGVSTGVDFKGGMELCN